MILNFMKIISSHSLIFLSSISFFFSCAKKTQPDTVHNVNSSNQSDASSSSDNFNSGLNNDFADLGTPINGSFDDGLSERDPSLSAFNDESASRPFEPVLFGFDQYNINATERDKISRIADYLKKNPNAKLLIEGYCDWKGTPDYNKSLGDRRAKSVKDALIALGVNGSRLATEAYGETRPISDNKTVGGRKANRRVKFQRRVEIKIAK